MRIPAHTFPTLAAFALLLWPVVPIWLHATRGAAIDIRGLIYCLPLFAVFAFVEELIHRKGILGFMVKKRVNPILALLVSAVVFSAMHFTRREFSASNSLFFLSLGLVFGVAWLQYGIWMSWSLHFANNAAQLALLGFNRFGHESDFYARPLVHINARDFQSAAIVISLVLIGMTVFWYRSWCFNLCPMNLKSKAGLLISKT